MGFNNTLCAVTGKLIKDGDPVVAIILTPNNKTKIRGFNTYHWDLFSPVNLPLEATWNYGLVDLKPYEYDNIDHETSQTIKIEFVKLIQKLTNSDLTLKDIISNNLEFEEINSVFLKILKTEDVIELLQANIENETNEENKAFYIQELERQEKYKSYLLSLKDSSLVSKVPVSFMVIHKNIFDKIVNNYGKTQLSEYVKIPSTEYQKNKDNFKEIDLDDFLSFFEGTKNYVGHNKPFFSLTDLFGKCDENIEFKKYKTYLHLDFCVFDDFFSILGKQYFPNMFFSETPTDYGFQEAHNFLNELRK